MANLFKKSDNKKLNRDDILKADDIQTERVNVPEWGGDVFVKGTTGREFSNLQNQIIKRKGSQQTLNLENIQTKLVILCTYDEDGNKMFTKHDEDALTGKSSSALQRIFKVAQNLSGLGDDEIDDLAEDLKENPTEDSLSD